jgi:hypothetical protein
MFEVSIDKDVIIVSFNDPGNARHDVYLPIEKAKVEHSQYTTLLKCSWGTVNIQSYGALSLSLKLWGNEYNSPHVTFWLLDKQKQEICEALSCWPLPEKPLFCPACSKSGATMTAPGVFHCSACEAKVVANV